jgi:hypothetical protein
VLYLLGALLGLISLFVARLSTGTIYALIGALALCALIAVFFLETAPYEKQIKLQKSSSLS